MRIWSEQNGPPSKVFDRDPSSSLMSLIFYQNSKVLGQPSGTSTTYRNDMYNIYMMIQQEDRAHIIFSLVISHHAWFFHMLSSPSANILSTWTLKLFLSHFACDCLLHWLVILHFLKFIQQLIQFWHLLVN